MVMGFLNKDKEINVGGAGNGFLTLKVGETS